MPKNAEEMTEAELTAEIARLSARCEALKALRTLRIATTQTRDRAKRLMGVYSNRIRAALDTLEATA